MYGMRKKTTIYLPDDVKKGIENIAIADKCSEAEVIREALTVLIASRQPPKPLVPLPGLTLGRPDVAARAGELLDGFGE